MNKDLIEFIQKCKSGYFDDELKEPDKHLEDKVEELEKEIKEIKEILSKIDNRTYGLETFGG
jgi:RNA polymerase-binding transcription factor DksA